MRIGLEVSPLAVNASGIPNYIRRLLKGFSAVGEDHEFFLYTNRPIPEDLHLPDNFSTVILNRPSPRFQLWFQTALPRRLKKDRIDVFHGLFSRLPLLLPVPGVITVHDLSAYKMPGLHKRHTHMTNLLYPMFVKKASAIIAVSAFTAKEIVSCFPGASRKTVVVHEAAPPEYSMVTEGPALERTREKLDLPSRFVLFLGTLEPRKNLPRLLEAFSAICDEIPHKLVLSGPIGWKSSELKAKLQDPAIRSRVQLTGFVDAGDIPALLSLAEIFVYPSLYEGFGLPVLEAMACGTPVITSSTSSLPEVAGDAALLVDPESVPAISKAVVRLAGDENLRENLRERGLERSRRFSWTRAAGETLDVYRQMIAALESG